MEQTMRPADEKTAGTDRQIGVRVANAVIFILLFAGYSLTFLVPKFYGATDRYVGMFVFLLLAILSLINADPLRRLLRRERETIVTAVLLLLIGINILIVHSGKGAFFVLADFVLIWYLSDKIRLTKREVLCIGGAYALMLTVWFAFVYPKMFAQYGFYGYNTNTAATFTIYSLLIAFVFVQCVTERFPAAGFFAVLLLVKGVQLAFYHRARGAFVMLVVFLLLYYVIPKGWLAKKGVFRALVLLATFGSLVFVAAYTLAGTLGVNYQLPFFYKEVFSGREEIWKEFFLLFCRRPLTGIGTNVEISSFFEFNVHNAMYNILVVYGLPSFLLTLCLVIGKLIRLREHAAGNRICFCALCVTFAVFFESYFDVDLLWVDYALNLLVLLLFVNHEQSQISSK